MTTLQEACEQVTERTNLIPWLNGKALAEYAPEDVPMKDQFDLFHHTIDIRVPLVDETGWCYGHTCMLTLYPNGHWWIGTYLYIPTNLITPEFLAYRKEREEAGFCLYENNHDNTFFKSNQGTFEVYVGAGNAGPDTIRGSDIVYCVPGVEPDDGFSALEQAAAADGYQFAYRSGDAQRIWTK